MTAAGVYSADRVAGGTLPAPRHLGFTFWVAT